MYVYIHICLYGMLVVTYLVLLHIDVIVAENDMDDDELVVFHILQLLLLLHVI